MRERNTDVGALVAAALAATLSMVTASGPYTALSAIISMSLLAIWVAYVLGRPRSQIQRGAVALVGALVLLPMVGLTAQKLDLPAGGFPLVVIWLVMAAVLFAADWRLTRAADPAEALTTPSPVDTDIAVMPVTAVGDEEAIYRRVKPLAHSIRTVLQMVIGVAILAVLSLKVIYGFTLCPGGWQAVICEKPVLELVAHALTYSAGVELAYMLFTPGPDEAVQPVILGMAAAVLIIVSKPSSDWHELLIAPLLCAAIALLFLVDRKFIKH